jgi:hypothetical protein
MSLAVLRKRPAVADKRVCRTIKTVRAGAKVPVAAAMSHAPEAVGMAEAAGIKALEREASEEFHGTQ